MVPTVKTVLSATATHRLRRPPLFLILHLKRFKHTVFVPHGPDVTFYKDNRTIDVPVELDLADFFGSVADDAAFLQSLRDAGFSVDTSGTVSDIKYGLVSLTTHIGEGRLSGHHVAYTSVVLDGKTVWLEHDDTCISQVSLEYVLAQQAQLVMYVANQPSKIAFLRRNGVCIDGSPGGGARESPLARPADSGEVDLTRDGARESPLARPADSGEVNLTRDGARESPLARPADSEEVNLTRDSAGLSTTRSAIAGGNKRQRSDNSAAIGSSLGALNRGEKRTTRVRALGGSFAPPKDGSDTSSVDSTDSDSVLAGELRACRVTSK